MTRVVNIKRGEAHDVYIGRAGHGEDGYFGNPYGRASRLANIEMFRSYFHARIGKDPEFKRRVLELKGKRLGCFCRPAGGFRGGLLCHGQVIAGWLDGVEPNDAG